MLTPLSMIDAEYTLWIPGVAYVSWLKEDLDYEEFNYTCLMLSLTVEVCALSSHPFHSYSSFVFLYMVMLN